MKNVLNQLIQLQELDFALAEEKASSVKMPLAKLEAAVARSLAALPEDLAVRYQRLRQRHPLVVVPIVNNTCAPCRMALPIALINAVKAGEEVQTCPHCGRFLYYPSQVARQTTRPGRDTERPVEAGIARFSHVRLMQPRLEASTREEAIRELANLLAKQGYIEAAEPVAELALQREAIISTAVEHGLAFPHVRDVEGGSLTLALGLKPKGIEFGAPDGKLTRIIFFLVIPAPAAAFYLRLLAGLVKTFASSEARQALLACETPATLWKTLIRLTRNTVP